MDELSSHLLKTFEFFKRLGNTKNYLNGDITSWMRNMEIVSFNPQIENSEYDLLFPPQKEIIPILEFFHLIIEFYFD